MHPVTSLTLAALIASGTPAGAIGPVVFGPDLQAEGWQDLSFFGRKPVDFTAEGVDTLRIVADRGISVIWRQLPRAFAGAGAAAWRWRVDAGVPPTDLARRGQDDRDIALYFLFADDPAALDDPPASLRAAMRQGRALVYVWGGDAPAGSVIPNPNMGGRGQILVRRPAASPTGQWKTEKVDLRADFRRAYGSDPGPLIGVGVSSDSDNSGTRTEALLSDLVVR